jgi:hypothetical protein
VLNGPAEELDGPAVSALRLKIVEVEQRWSVIGWVTKNLLSRTPPCFGTPTNTHCARVVGYGPFSLCVIHKEGLCPSSRDINRMMMMNNYKLGSRIHADGPASGNVHNKIIERR